MGFTVLLSLLLEVLAYITSGGTTEVTVNGEVFGVVKNPVLASSRNRECQKMGFWRMFRPVNKARTDAVIKAVDAAIGARLPYRYYMIAATDQRQEGIWCYSNTSTRLSYTDFMKNEPNGNTLENCAFVMYNAWQWADTACRTTNYPIVCENKIVTCPTITSQTSGNPKVTSTVTYSPGDTVSWRCDGGTYTTDITTQTCSSQGQWNPSSRPTCHTISTPVLFTNTTQLYVGDNAYLACNTPENLGVTKLRHPVTDEQHNKNVIRLMMRSLQYSGDYQCRRCYNGGCGLWSSKKTIQVRAATSAPKTISTTIIAATATASTTTARISSTTPTTTISTTTAARCPLPTFQNSKEMGSSSRTVGASLNIECLSKNYLPLSGNTNIICQSSLAWSGPPLQCTYFPPPTLTASSLVVATGDYIEISCTHSSNGIAPDRFVFNFLSGSNKNFIRQTTNRFHKESIQLNSTARLVCKSCNRLTIISCVLNPPEITIKVDGFNGGWSKWNRTSYCVGVEQRRCDSPPRSGVGRPCNGSSIRELQPPPTRYCQWTEHQLNTDRVTLRGSGLLVEDHVAARSRLECAVMCTILESCMRMYMISQHRCVLERKL